MGENQMQPLVADVVESKRRLMTEAGKQLFGIDKLNVRANVRSFILGCIAVIIVLLFLESFTRIMVTLREDLQGTSPDWYKYSPELGWERRENFTGHIKSEPMTGDPSRYIRSFDNHGYFRGNTDQLEAGKRPMILTLGDSNTFGYGTPFRETYSEELHDSLANVSVINLGVMGYTSFQGYKLLAQRIDILKPNVVVVSFNFNDRRWVNSPDRVDSDVTFLTRARIHQTDSLREHLYLYKLMHFVFSRIGAIASDNAIKSYVDIRTVEARVSPARYREYLRKIAQICQKRNTSMIFLILSDNPAQTEHLYAGIANARRGDYDTAERELRIAVNLGNVFSDLARKHLAEIYMKQGNEQAAQAVALVPASGANSEHGGPPIYLDTDYNEIMRSVAQEYGAKVVEAGQVLNNDPSVFLDFCHPDGRGHQRIASTLKQAIEPMVAMWTGNPGSRLYTEPSTSAARSTLSNKGKY